MANKNIDYKLFFAVLLIVIFGMVMISSVSVFSSFKVTNGLVSKGLATEAFNYFYVLRNIIHVIVGFATMAFIIKIDFKFFEKNAKYFFWLSLVLLFIVLVKGAAYKGASAWISIPGVPFDMQPAEFFKIALIVFLAAIFKKYKSRLKDLKKGFLPFLLLLTFITIIIGAQPDFGTLMVILPVSTLMFYYAGANIKHIMSLALLGLTLIFIVYQIGNVPVEQVAKKLETKQDLNMREKFNYITQRINNFLANGKDSIKKKNINYQTEQGLIAIGSGGFKGRGFGQSIQKFGYLPQVQEDFIFAVIVEELGFIGGSSLIFLYLFIGYRGFYIASRVKDEFAKFTAMGVTSWVLFQGFVNIGVVLNVVPLTGITLPFVSYGGSSILSLMIGLGILLSISRHIEEKSSYSRVEKRKFLV